MSVVISVDSRSKQYRLGEILTLTEHGQPCAKIMPVPKLNRLTALAALRAIGPVTLPKRK